MPSPAERRLRAQKAAYTLHSKYNSTDLTAPARRAFWAKFEAQVDPNHELSESERARRAEAARRAHMLGMAAKSAAARRKAAVPRDAA